jgi:ribonuclease BN (tRNA processing enzyme)
MSDEFTLTFCGVRGSFPVPGGDTRRTGGNTASLLLEAAGLPLVLDAGTGIIRSGRLLAARGARPIHVFLSHLHSDHIMGLPFFAPLFDPRQEVVLHYPADGGGRSRRALEALFVPPYSPITLQGIRARLRFAPLRGAGGAVSLGDGVEVAYARHDSHPCLGVLLYRVACGGRSLVYATDVESPQVFDAATRAFVAGADLLVHDSQYFEDDYVGAPRAAAGRAGRPLRPGTAGRWPRGTRRGFGHSTMTMAARNAATCGVGRLYLFHYDPRYSDAMLEEMGRLARREFPRTYLAREGKTIHIRR